MRSRPLLTRPPSWFLEWMVRLIPFYTHDDSDPAWEALKPLEDKPSDEQQ